MFNCWFRPAFFARPAVIGRADTLFQSTRIQTIMTPIKRFQGAMLLALTLCVAGQVQAVDAVHTITLSVKATARSEEVTRGDIITTRPEVFRATTRDVIEAMGVARETSFGPRAQLLLIRRNIQQSEGEDVSIVVRETGRADTDVTELIGFEPGTDVETGTFHVPTGRARSTALSIGTMSLQIPQAVSLVASGISTEKRGSVNIGGEETSSNLVSLSAKLAGQGTLIDGETETFVIVEATLTVGAARLVSSPVQ